MIVWLRIVYLWTESKFVVFKNTGNPQRVTRFLLAEWLLIWGSKLYPKDSKERISINSALDVHFRRIFWIESKVRIGELDR